VSEAWLVADLGFGDAGKGTITDFLVRDRGARAVIRWNGGAQAGHNVVTPDGRHHTFAQFGAGTFVAGARTHLACDVVIHPLALWIEAAVLRRSGVSDALDRLTISEQARCITPFHQAAGRLRELARGAEAHGTCGVGVGETVADALAGRVLRAGALARGSRRDLLRHLRRQQRLKRETLDDILRALGDHPLAQPEREILEDPAVPARWLEALAPLRARWRVVSPGAIADLLAAPVVFEGAQGVLLDEWVGFHPHTTWSTCTVQPALDLLRAHGFAGKVHRLGVLRTFTPRHGAGPLPSQAAALADLPEPHNDAEGWQGDFRRGWLDLVLLRYALAVCPVDALAVTHLDRLRPGWRYCGSWRARHPLPPALLRADPHDPRRALGIRPGPRRDLARQARLTAAIQDVWAETAPLPDRFIPWLEDALERPVRLLSSGSTAARKRWRGAPPDG